MHLEVCKKPPASLKQACVSMEAEEKALQIERAKCKEPLSIVCLKSWDKISALESSVNQKTYFIKQMAGIKLEDKPSKGTFIFEEPLYPANPKFYGQIYEKPAQPFEPMYYIATIAGMASGKLHDPLTWVVLALALFIGFAGRSLIWTVVIAAASIAVTLFLNMRWSRWSGTELFDKPSRVMFGLSAMWIMCLLFWCIGKFVRKLR